MLPAALVSSSVTAPEVRLAAALKGYADTILQPVPASALGETAGRARAGVRSAADETGEQLGEIYHTVSEGFEGVSAGLKTFGGEAGAGAAEFFEPVGEAFGYAFAVVAFQEATAVAFGEGGAARAAAGAATAPPLLR